MNLKEAYRPLKTTEGVIKQSDISFLRSLIPDANFQLEVVKTEGDYLSSLDTNSKLPKGYALVRVFTQFRLVRDFSVDLNKIRLEETPNNKYFVTPSVTESEPVLSEILCKKVEAKPSPATFRQEFRQKSNFYQQSSFKEKQTVIDESPKKGTTDSLGYFKALNLSPSELEGLTEEQAKKNIKTKYWAAANKAHPDRGGTNDAMVQVNNAMEVISNPGLRRAYQTQTGQFAPKQH